jgi:hypothetical protein
MFDRSLVPPDALQVSELSVPLIRSTVDVWWMIQSVDILVKEVPSFCTHFRTRKSKQSSFNLHRSKGKFLNISADFHRMFFLLRSRCSAFWDVVPTWLPLVSHSLLFHIMNSLLYLRLMPLTSVYITESIRVISYWNLANDSHNWMKKMNSKASFCREKSHSNILCQTLTKHHGTILFT